MRALFGVRSNAADAYYRAIAPGTMMRYSGYDVEVRRPTVDDADEFDVLVLQRHCDAIAELIMIEFQRKGKPVIYDCDDWLFGLPPTVDGYDDYFLRGRMRPTALLLFHERLLRQADVVTVSTAPLAERLDSYNDDIRVIPNCELWTDWDMLSVPGKEISPVIGWMGLPSHWDAWKEIHRAVEIAVRANDAWLVVLGFPEVAMMFSPELRARTVVQPLVPFAEFHKMRQLIMTFDVGLAWLEDTPFSRCKSPLRILQYGAAGVPIVAGHVVYGDLLESGDFGTVCHTPQDLTEGLSWALTHPERAKEQAANWQTEVWKHHTYETQWRAWRDLLCEVVGEGEPTVGEG